MLSFEKNDNEKLLRLNITLLLSTDDVALREKPSYWAFSIAVLK